MADVRQTPDRIFSLDVLRGVAASLVLIRHAPAAPDATSSDEPIFEMLQRIGWCGVDLFFVLSGFLIANVLLREWESTGRLNLSRFWMRRGMKIWPSYYAAYGGMVGLWLARDLWRGDWLRIRESVVDAAVNCVFLQNYLKCNLWPHSWSLAVEEHFYLALPLVITLTTTVGVWSGWSRRGWMRATAILAGSVAAVVLSLRIINAAEGKSWHVNYYQSHLRIDSLSFGVLLSCVWRYMPDAHEAIRSNCVWGLLVAGCAATVPILFPLERSAICSTVGFTVLYLGFGWLVLLAAVHPNFGRDGGWHFWPFRLLAALGVYSYTVYLAHSVIFGIPGVASTREVALRVMTDAGAANAVVIWIDRGAFWIASIAGGIALSHIVERPFLRLRSRWFPGGSPVAGAGQVSVAVLGRTIL